MRLRIENLSKSYGGFLALDHVHLELRPGIYALLGPNGAGKSTLMNLITGILKADSGQILYDGTPTDQMGRAFRERLGYVPQRQGLYETFTARRFLSYIAALKGMDSRSAAAEIKRVLALVNLQDDGDKYLGAMSGGMKQRMLIAQAIMNRPEILILDEPTAGLDPKERIRIRNIISQISSEKIVLLATHVVSDIEHMAKSVILIKKGKIIAQEAPLTLCQQIDGKVFEIQTTEAELPHIQNEFLVSVILQEARGIKVRIISEQRPDPFAYTAVFPTLEDVYLYSFAEESPSRERSVIR